MLETEKFLPYARQFIDAEDIEEVSATLSENMITRGEHVDAFEQAIAQYCGAQYAVAFNSGTSALQATCHVVDLGPQDRIITTPNTFVASVTCGMQRGARPILVDIDRNTGNFNLDQLEAVLKQQRSSRGKTVILPVHFSGIPVDMERLDRLISDPDTVVIEDAAHALGSTYIDGQMIGSCAWSQMTIFSFHPAKTITTGEGGMVLTNDPMLYHRLRRFRNNGIERDPAYLKEDLANWYEGYYEVIEMTGNYNFTDFQAALGLSQLQRIDTFIDKRRELMDHGYSVSQRASINLSQDHFFSTLLNLPFVRVPDHQRKRKGVSQRPGGPDTRPFWQPRMVFEGNVVEDVPFSAWTTQWPKDGSVISGKWIETYLPESDGRFVSYLPFWLQVSGNVQNIATIYIIDSGKNLTSPISSIPQPISRDSN